MLNKELLHKLIDYMPDRFLIEQFTEVLYKLNQMVERQDTLGFDINWEELIIDINSWKKV